MKRKLSKILGIGLTLALLASLLLTAAPVAAVDNDLAVNDENPWEDGAFTFENILPGGDPMAFDFKLHNVGDDPGILTFSMSYVENDEAGAPDPNMSADEFASLIYVETVSYQYIWLDHPDKVTHPDGYIGSVRDDLPSWLGMDLNVDGKVSLYEICQIGTLHYDEEDVPLDANLEGNPLNGAEITYFIKFQLGDSLDGGVAGDAIQTGGEVNDSQGDGVSVTITATLGSDIETSSGNVFQAAAAPTLDVIVHDAGAKTITLTFSEAVQFITKNLNEPEFVPAVVAEADIPDILNIFEIVWDDGTPTWNVGGVGDDGIAGTEDDVESTVAEGVDITTAAFTVGGTVLTITYTGNLVSIPVTNYIVGYWVAGTPSGEGHDLADLAGNLIADVEDGSIIPWFTVGLVHNIDTGEYFNTIQDAINDSDTDAGDTIIVAAGTYQEQVIIDKALTLLGANAGINPVTGTRVAESIIDAGSGPNAVRINTGVAVTFQGFKVQGWTANGVSQEPFATGTAKILDNIVIGPTATPGPGNSIIVWGDNSVVKGNEVDGTLCTPEEWEGAGIMVVDGDNVVIEYNWVYSADTGIAVFGATGNTVDGTKIRYNTVEDSVRGIRVDAVTAVTNTTIEFNLVDGNEIGIESCNDGTKPSGTVANYNNIVNNGIGVQSVLGVGKTGEPETVNAKVNYWGDISGPEHEAALFEDFPNNPGGLGNAVSDNNVNYLPWLTRPFETVLADNIQYFGVPMVYLNTGWNTLSTPVALDPGDTIDGVEYPGCNTWEKYKLLGDGLNTHATSPAYAFNGAIQDWVPLIGENADYPIKPCDAIYVRMASPDVGAILYSPEPTAPTKDVYQGWNLVGLASLDPMISKNALTSLYMVTNDLTGYSVVISPPLSQGPWTFVRDGSPKIMEPTRGYWVFMENGPDTLAGFTFTPFSLEGAPGGGGLGEVAFEWYSMTTGSADASGSGDDVSFTYPLPWTFPFAGKEIVEIAIDSNGYIGLLESGESYSASGDYGTMGYFKNEYPESDFIFAWEDDLTSSYNGFHGVEYNGEVVVVHWETEAFYDGDDELLNYFQVWLFPDGSIQWNFKEFNFETLDYGVSTAIYESDSGILLNVALAMGEPSGMCITPEKSYRYFGQYWP